MSCALYSGVEFMKINADIYVKDVPGALVESLEPISILGGNIVGVIHNREQTIGERILINIIFNMDANLEALKKEWKSRDVIVANIGEDFEITPVDCMLIGNINTNFIEDLMEKMHEISDIKSVDIRYLSNMHSDSRTALISANF